VQRREFLGGAATMAGASFMGRGAGTTWPGILAATPPDPPPAPEMNAATERKMKRWQEQRWLLDAVVQTVGIEWDQARVAYTLGPCGPDATGDFIGIRSRIRKYNDIAREYTRAAVRRERLARQFEAEGHAIAARESYFIAALLYGSAQWPIFAVTRENLALSEKKSAAYAKYMELADHEIRKVEIPFGGNGKSLPGYLHLPLSERRGGFPPCGRLAEWTASRKWASLSMETSSSSAASPCWRSKGRARANAAFVKSIPRPRIGCRPARWFFRGFGRRVKSIPTASRCPA
jgi:hypothetical protein